MCFNFAWHSLHFSHYTSPVDRLLVAKASRRFCFGCPFIYQSLYLVVILYHGDCRSFHPSFARISQCIHFLVFFIAHQLRLHSNSSLMSLRLLNIRRPVSSSLPVHQCFTVSAPYTAMKSIATVLVPTSTPMFWMVTAPQ